MTHTVSDIIEERAEDIHRNFLDCWMCNYFRGQRGDTLRGYSHKIDNARGKASLL